MSNSSVSRRDLRTSTFSGGSNCVQVGSTEGMVMIGDSKNPGQVLFCTRQGWAAFLEGAKRGEFDEFDRELDEPRRHDLALPTLFSDGWRQRIVAIRRARLPWLR